ncbi:MAG TPA: hypothetical protein VFR24_13055 [Candidatus Angelobacter sp.]|nr:hypothetical protein [Candidatus Angelobacter sp.]
MTEILCPKPDKVVPRNEDLHIKVFLAGSGDLPAAQIFAFGQLILRGVWLDLITVAESGQIQAPENFVVHVPQHEAFSCIVYDGGHLRPQRRGGQNHKQSKQGSQQRGAPNTAQHPE